MESSAYKYEYYTADTYYDAIADRENRTELIDGLIVDLASPRVQHQELATDFCSLLRSHIRKNGGSCKAVAGIDVKLDDINIVVPDIMIGCDPDKFDAQKYNGAPDFVAEIVSTNRSNDYDRKLWLYRRSGVREYWIIDPQHEMVLVYFFEEDAAPQVYDFHTPIPVRIWDGALCLTIAELEKV